MVRRLLACLLLMSCSGCAAVPSPSTTAQQKSLPPDLTGYYAYDRKTLKATVKSSNEKSGYRILRVELGPENTTDFRPIRADWYRPQRSGRLPVVLMSPILAGNDLYVREFARFYAARGLHAVLVYRQKEVFSADRDLGDIEKHFQESIIQLRQTIDWLETQEGVDPERIGTFAVSLGAILTTVLAAVEPRIKASVFGLPAGRIAEIIMSSQDKTIRKRRKAYLEKHGWSQRQALERLQQVIISEPMRFAPAIDPGRTLVIVGLFDRVLGIGRSLDLWQTMGRPKLIALPTGHYTAYFATPYLKLVTYSFLKRSLKST